MKLINALERKLSRLRIQPFFKYIVLSMAGVYLLDLFFQQFYLTFRMVFIRDNILRGEIWRLITFVLVPPGGNILQAALMLYFYYFVGTALESRWGARRFLVFYVVGVLSAIAAGFISGIGVNTFLNMSLFFAFAITYPDFQLLLFFVLPIKVKWLAALNGLYYLYYLINGSWDTRLAILASLINILLFFGGDLYNQANIAIRQWKRRRDFRQ